MLCYNIYNWCDLCGWAKEMAWLWEETVLRHYFFLTFLGYEVVTPGKTTFSNKSSESSTKRALPGLGWTTDPGGTWPQSHPSGVGNDRACVVLVFCGFEKTQPKKTIPQPEVPH